MYATINMIEDKVPTSDVIRKYSSQDTFNKVRMTCEFNNKKTEVELPIRILIGLTTSDRESTFEGCGSLFKNNKSVSVVDVAKAGFMLIKNNNEKGKIYCVACNTCLLHSKNNYNYNHIDISDLEHMPCPISEKIITREFSISVMSAQPCNMPERVSVESGLLEYLYYYISKDEKSILDNIANNNSYESKFTDLMNESPTSSVHMDIDTYRTIYWALKNNKISAMQFLEYYHWLSLSLMFHPEKSTHADISSFVKSFEIRHKDNEGKAIEWSDLNDVKYKIYFNSVDNNILNYMHNKMPFIKPSSPFEEISYWCYNSSRNVKLCKEVKFTHSPDVNKLEMSFTFVSFYSCFKFLESVGKDKRINMRPTFGYGDKYGLLELRREGAHPIALPFPDLKTLETPDGVWSGKLAYAHDLLHVYILNKLGVEKRNTLLQFNDYIVSPLLEYTRQKINEIECNAASEDENIQKNNIYFLNNLNRLTEILPDEIKPHGADQDNLTSFDYFIDHSAWHKHLIDAEECIIDQANAYANSTVYISAIVEGALRGSVHQYDDKNHMGKDMFFSINLVCYQAKKNKNLDLVFGMLKDLISGKSEINNKMLPFYNSKQLYYIYYFWKQSSCT
ncbi:MAG: hypothetical protein KAG53_05355 [Endozoicomonadaceae bacterium]|nr:hypothetical protein [Endozoicomonadaceae bacterium]